MRTIAIIPARFGSTRLPGKALLRDTGKFLVQHVYESVQACEMIDDVLVATDDGRIVEAVRSFGGEACLTDAAHTTGTDRVAEAAQSLGLADDDVVFNVQGDEPEVAPTVLASVMDTLVSPSVDCSIATAAAPFDDGGSPEGPGSPVDPHRVKVVVDGFGRALYFSRSLIPFPRETGGRVDRPSRWLLHLGVYAFRWATLRALAGGKAGGSEGLSRIEGLEQLAWLAAGYGIAVCIVEHRFVGIDNAEDYARFVQRMGRHCGV